MTRILHIDDSDAIRLLYEEELAEEGYEVVGVGSCEDILDQIASFRPNLIVLEPKLPEADGLEILQMIRNTNYDMPVVICTAYPNIKYDLRCIAADYFVVKQSDLSELKLKVGMALDCRGIFQSEAIAEGLPDLRVMS